MHLFDKTQVDLNWHNPQVRAHIYEMINFWIQLGVKAFRLDVIDLIAKEPEKMITTRGPKFEEYLHELVSHTFKNDCLTVGECWNFGPADTLSITGKGGLTQVFHFSHINWIYPKWEAEKISCEQLCNKINEWQNAPEVIDALVLNNHDLPRIHSYWFGNQPENNYYTATLVFTLNAILRGNLYIYQGEEIGMTNDYQLEYEHLKDVESINKYKQLLNQGESSLKCLELIRHVSRDNARTPFQWNSELNAGFSDALPWMRVNPNYQYINYELDVNSEQSIFKYYMRVIAFRKQNYQLFTGKVKARFVAGIIIISNDNFKVFLNPSAKTKKMLVTQQALISNRELIEGELLPYQAIITKK